MTRRIGAMVAATLVLCCTAPAAAGLIDIEPVGDPVGNIGHAVCEVTTLVADMVAASPDICAVHSAVLWPKGGDAGAESPFAGVRGEAGSSLIELTQLDALTVNEDRITDDVTKLHPASVPAKSADAVVDCSVLIFPLAGEGTRMGPEVSISLLGSPARG